MGTVNGLRPLTAKLHLKVRLKIEQIARLRAEGVPDSKIKLILGIKQSGLSRIVKLPEFIEVQEAIVAGKLTSFDQILATRTRAMHEFFAPAVPAAMRTLVEAVLNKKATLKDRMEAAKEILDRDPRKAFSKNGVRGAEGFEGAALPEDILASRTTSANVLREQLATPLTTGQGTPQGAVSIASGSGMIN